MTDRPRLRTELIVRKLTNRDESYVIVKDPEGQKYFKFEAWENELLELVDGTRTLEELAASFHHAHPELGVDLQFTVDYVDALRRLGFLVRTDRERHLVMMDKLKTLRRRRITGEGSSMFQIRIPMFDPDRMMDRIMPWIRWVWSPWFVLPWVAVFVVVLGFLVYHWDLYWSGFFSLLNFAEKGFWGWVGFFALLTVVSVWHELGHGFTVKHFGGEVHDIGFMIFYLQPAFYCGIDDSYLFPSLSRRVFCTFGGPYFELMMCSVAAAVWLLTPTEWWVHGLALAVVFLTGLSVILLNVNPLIKLDGYYVLMDWLDVPDLREESFRYIGGLFRRHVLRLDVPERAISRRRRRIFLWYGLLAVAYTTTIMIFILTLLRGWFVGWLGPAGYLAMAAVIVWVLRKRIVKGVGLVKHFYLDKRDLLRSGKRRVALGGGVALAAVLLTIPRSATRLNAVFEVEPGARAVLRAPADSVVRDVRVREGSAVRRGDVLAVLESRDLVAARGVAAADSTRIRRQATAAAEGGDQATVGVLHARAQEADTRAGLLDRKLGTLDLRAPIDGVVVTPRIEERLRRSVSEGDVICTVAGLDAVRLSIPLSERLVEEIRDGVPVRMLPTARRDRTLRARVLSVSPAAEEVRAEAQELDLVRNVRLVRVQVVVDNPGGLLRPGMTGRIQFLTRPRSAVGKLWWSFRRWASSVFW